MFWWRRAPGRLSHLEREGQRCLLSRPSCGAGGGGGGGAGAEWMGLVPVFLWGRRVGSVNRDGIPRMRARVCLCQGLCLHRRLPPCLSSARATAPGKVVGCVLARIA